LVFLSGISMNTVPQVLAALKKKGTAQTRKTYARHGIPEPMFGVKIGDLKPIAKQLKGNQDLALALYESGNYDAMYLAAMVADGAQMNKRQLEAWAKGATCGMLSEYAVPWVANETPHARDLAVKWINSKNEALASSGWCTYAGIVATKPDDALDLAEIEALVDQVVEKIDAAPNRVRYAMNSFVIAVGAYVKPLLKHAKQAAKSIGKVEVDMGDTACRVPLATEYIQKIETMGRVGRKRKTLRC
jgi:3-methyladenine DNA glycosylase AlkD